MHKRPGGQNGGNHCHRTEYRKKNEKKLRQPKRPLGQHEMLQHSHHMGPRRKKERERT